ncbi:MAG: hypothetical protein IPK83_13895 [Planctomycetes bacterium]|nr:hypothetical protein [Planctomycetota bacterium]
MKFSRDGKYLATASTDCTARIIELETGRQITFFSNHGNAGFKTRLFWFPLITPLFLVYRQWFPFVVAGTYHKFGVVHGGIYCVDIAPDNQTAASAGYDCIRIWNARNGIQIQEITYPNHLPSRVHSVEFSPNAARLLVATSMQMSVHEIASGRMIWCGGPDKGEINSAEFSQDGKSIHTRSSSGIVEAWNANTGEGTYHLEPASLSEVYHLSLSRNGERILAAGDHQISELFAFDCAPVRPSVAVTTIRHLPQYLVWLPNERFCLARTAYAIHLLSVESGNSIFNFKSGLMNPYCPIAVSQDSRFFAYSCDSNGQYGVRLYKLP